jgi:hypothetical protein
MKLLLPTLHGLRAERSATLNVRLSSREAADAFVKAAREEGLCVKGGVPLGGLWQSPTIVAALVLGCVFALIGLQGVNALLGLPRVDSLFWMPSRLAGVLFTIAGVALGTVVGAVIAPESGAPTQTLRVRGDRSVITRIASEYDGKAA